MKKDGHPFVFKGKRYIAYEVEEQDPFDQAVEILRGDKYRMIEEDCDCRHCQPDKWVLDTDRDIWIKKA